MKKIIIMCVLTLSLGLQAAEKPNVIVLLTDDQGSVDLNSYGAKDLVTPNMDKIVSSGVKFTQFYVAPVCSPTRASLLTGKTPQHVKITEVVRRAKPNDGLSNEEYTMAEMFKDAGYATAHIGKWHLGSSEDKQPNAQGFDYSFGHLGGCIDNFSHSSYWQNGANYHVVKRIHALSINKDIYIAGVVMVMKHLEKKRFKMRNNLLFFTNYIRIHGKMLQWV